MYLGACFEIDGEKAVTWDNMRKPDFAEKAMDML